MKRSLAVLLAVYLVTWKTFSAVSAGGTVDHAKNGAMSIEPACRLVMDTHHQEFFDWFKAAALATELKLNPDNFDVRLWEMYEPKMRSAE
ncbi:MAG TPA: hypothetical protein VD994_18030 [Prosthecobacter sp.]|nr:hypothetical protein [Prosthecobacter sp.]